MKAKTGIRRRSGYRPSGSYAYLSTRVRAKIAKLVQPQQYDKLLQMDLPEIAKFMEETEYKREIDELALKESGERLILHALMLNQVRVFRHIYDMSPLRFSSLFREYLREWDVGNIKVILRSFLSGEDKDEARGLLAPLGSLDFRFISSLLDKKDASEVLSALKSTEYAPVFRDVESLDQASLIRISVALDDFVFKNISSIVELAEEGKFFTDFMKLRADVENFKILLKLKKEGLPYSDARPYFTPNGSLSVERLVSLYKLSFEEIFAYLRSMPIGPFVEPGILEFNSGRSLGLIEVGLDRYLLGNGRSLLRQHPLSIAPVLGFIAAKVAEVKNIRTIVRGKHARLDNAFIRKYLITV